MNKKSLIVGASGLVGGEILNLLSHEGNDVTIISRRLLKLNLPNVKESIVDFNEIENEINFPAVDHVYIALGKRLDTSELIYIKKPNRDSFIKVDHDYVIAVAKKAFSMGARSISIVSAVGVDKNSMNLYLQIKGKVEEEIKSIGYDRFRIEIPVIEFFTKILEPLMFGPLQNFRNISAKQVAKAMISSMQDSSSGVTTLQYKEFIES